MSDSSGKGEEVPKEPLLASPSVLASHSMPTHGEDEDEHNPCFIPPEYPLCPKDYEECLVKALQEKTLSKENIHTSGSVKSIKEPIHRSVRNILIGSLLILLSNIVYLGNNYVVKFCDLSATQVLLARGVVQISVFSVLLLIQTRTIRTRAEKGCSISSSSSRSSMLAIYTGRIKLYLLLYSLLMASVSFACTFAIPLMPIGDLIVISFAAPAFSVVLSRVFVGTPLNSLSLLLAATILLGDVLVVQPPFIFHTDHHQGDRSDYYIGVGLCVYVAVVGSLGDILSTTCSAAGVSTNALMLASGAGTLILALASLCFLPGQAWVLVNLPYLVGSAVLVILAFWWVAAALNLTRNPPLVSMLRSTEILLSLISESLLSNTIPTPISCTGSVLVLLSVLGMSAQEQILQFLHNSASSCYRLIQSKPSDNKKDKQEDLTPV